MIFMVNMALHFGMASALEFTHHAREFSVSRPFFTIFAHTFGALERALADYHGAHVRQNNPRLIFFYVTVFVDHHEFRIC